MKGWSIRRTKTASEAIAVQVVRYANRKVVILKHIGSAHTAEEIVALEQAAAAWITSRTRQGSLFPETAARTLALATAQYDRSLHRFSYEVLQAVMERCGFSAICGPILADLAVMRIVEPASKLRSVTLLDRYFGIRHERNAVYRALPEIAKQHAQAEETACACARQLGAGLTVVLYDVTTLYFETFASDELRIPGFSKDNKSQQPQIVVGLLVTRSGFPLRYELFKGNTFEGKTMLPVIEEFAKAHGVAAPVVVADAAMISRENVTKLQEGGFSYIVGARLANCSPALITDVAATLGKQDGMVMRIATAHGDLICAFSAKRYRKDAAEMEKQIAKAKQLIEKQEAGKRAKFVKKDAQAAYVFDDALEKKARALLGIKGYYTNLPREKMSDADIIAHYHDLWNVEAAFRMSKNDLSARPVFHHKETSVQAHMVICFIALAVGKYLEIQTGASLRKAVDTLLSVSDAYITDTATGEQFILRSQIGADVYALLEKLRM